jgi:hypothetical protein
MQINMTTFAGRERQYIHRTLQSLFSTCDDPNLSVALIMGSEDQSHVQDWVNHPAIRIIPWDVESNPNLRWNCTLNKIRALRYGDEECTLICEDDVLFRKNWLTFLNAAAQEMGEEDYLLTLFLIPQKGEAVRPLKGKQLVRKYPTFVLHGAQAIYYPRKELRTKAADYLSNHLTDGCGDHLIGQFARSYANLYATTDPLVDHIGAISCFETEEI